MEHEENSRQHQEAKLHFQKIAAEAFPSVGKVRARQIAAYLGMGLSTFWVYVNQGRIKKPIKYGVRLSVWDAEYIHQLKREGIPLAKVEGEDA